MRWSILQSLLYLAAGAAVAEACAADNCARRITGVQLNPPMTQRRADCSSFMAVTVNGAAAASTTTVWAATVTVTRGADTKDTPANAYYKVKRSDAVTTEYITPTAVPAYATPCSGTSRYSSACSCWGITRVTIAGANSMVTVTSTSTITVNSQPTSAPGGTEVYPGCSKPSIQCSGSCKNVMTDTKNCGTCGNTCKSDATCVNGVCSEPLCAEVPAWTGGSAKTDCTGATYTDQQLMQAPPPCFCLQGINKKFCTAYGDLPIPAWAKNCTADSNCDQGQVCGTVPFITGTKVCVRAGNPSCTNVGSTSRLFRTRAKQRRSNKIRGKRYSDH
ncbi:hypothetical protein TWF694_000580 [Orbilia ellipsospora]|uniref:Uncharacterized protein n=1 Tax=Orbilia ellipsospora TaxID=2528407 RepID=A0AAV9XPD0_9PEZI